MGSLGKLPHKSTSSRKDTFTVGLIMPRPVKCKRDLGQEAEVQRWIEAILGEKVFNGHPYEDVLKDGVVLCKVMNTISPGSITKVNTTGSSFKLAENITRFQEALVKYGVNEKDLFQTNDLSEKRDLSTVTNTIFAFGRVISKNP